MSYIRYNIDKIGFVIVSFTLANYFLKKAGISTSELLKKLCKANGFKVKDFDGLSYRIEKDE